jgi:hypothetical protein
MHNKNNYSAKSLRTACLFSLVIAAAHTFSQPAAMLETALAGIRSVKTLHCSMVRKQSYKGINKTASCSFFYDRHKGKFAYVYASPYEYSFWVDDSTVCGVNRNHKRGYAVKAAVDSFGFGPLFESVHICAPLFSFERMDTLRVSLKASINDFLYFERPVGAGREVLKVNRNKKFITLMETFDSTGSVRRQTVFEYDTAQGKTPRFPRKIITRKNTTGIIETDTLLFAKVEIDKNIKESVFIPPAFTDVRTGK